MSKHRTVRNCLPLAVCLAATAGVITLAACSSEPSARPAPQGQAAAIQGRIDGSALGRWTAEHPNATQEQLAQEIETYLPQ